MDKEGWSGLERGEETCAGCSGRLAGQAAAFAVLSPEGLGFKRRDYCGPCFEKLPARPFSFWKRSAQAIAQQREGGDARREARKKDLDALMELFQRLSDGAAQKGSQEEKLRYLLALALCRKRRLQLVDLAREGGADCLVLRTSGDAEVITVPAPEL